MRPLLDLPMFVVPLVAFLVGLFAVIIVRRIAVRWGFLDNPDLLRKLQEAPVALGGGIAVWLATWLGWGVSLLYPCSVAAAVSGGGRSLAAMLSGSFLVLCLGVIDDRYSLRARYKLAGQVVVAVILVALGIRIDALSCFGFECPLGTLAFPITILWILLVVNAFNLIDGMDGFCGSLGLIASLSIAVLAYNSGHAFEALLALALAGALGAFLRFNLHPARIYLGDAGSMMIGLMIAALSVRCCNNGPGTAFLVLPAIALLLLPLLDTVTAVARRGLNGRSIFAPDRGHVQHCLRSRFGSPTVALGAAALIAALGAAGTSLSMVQHTGDLVSFVLIVLTVGVLICSNTFCASEWRLLQFRLAIALAPRSTSLADSGRSIDRECRVNGNRDWRELWHALVRAGEASGVLRIELAIDMTAAGESYRGHWSRPADSAAGPRWSIAHTLYSGGTAAGRIHVSGSVDPSEMHYFEKVERLVRDVERRLAPANIPYSSAPIPALSALSFSGNSALA